MNKIKGVYNGYELKDGRKFRVAEVSSNKYKLMTINEQGKQESTEIFFSRIKDYKEYLKRIEENM